MDREIVEAKVLKLLAYLAEEPEVLGASPYALDDRICPLTHMLSAEFESSPEIRIVTSFNYIFIYDRVGDTDVLKVAIPSPVKYKLDELDNLSYQPI